MTDTPATVGEYVKAARCLRGYSLRELEAASGVTNSTIKRVEDGFIAVPAPDVLLALVEALELDIRIAVALVEPYDRLYRAVINARREGKHDE